jgi:hypothetical protein
VIPVLLGGLTPDLLDKPLLYFGAYVHGRSIGHSLVFLGAAAVLWWSLRRFGRRGALPVGMWVLGIASHFVADFADDFVRGVLGGSLIVASWFIWPLGTPSTWDYSPGIALLPRYGGTTPLEVFTIALAILVAVRVLRDPYGRIP